MCWSGSIANVLRPYQGLVTRLVNGEHAGIAMWAIDRIHRCVEVMTELNFLGDEKTQDTVIRNFAILGEAAHSIEIFHAEFAAAHHQVSWALMYIMPMRNRVAHGYFKVDFELAWKTIHAD